VAEDDEEVTGKTGGPTSMESDISAIHLQSPHLREQPKTHGCLSPPTEPATEPTTEPITKPSTEPTTEPITKPSTSPVDRRISSSTVLYRDLVEQAIRGGDREAAATIYPISRHCHRPTSSRATSRPTRFSIR
jgi:hypothetical protein